MTDANDSLHARFLAFARNLAGAELIDELQLTNEQQQAKKADVFFAERSIICEVKALQTDVSGKVDRILEAHRDRVDFPHYYNTWPIDAVLAKLPDGAEIQRNIFEAISAGVASDVSDANRQIRETKSVFSLPTAAGLLVILNDGVAILDPRVIAQRVYQTLNKRTPDGAPRYQDIGGVWIISDAHRVQVTPELQGVPAIILTNPLTPDEKASAFLSDIQKVWADFAGLPLTELPEDAYGRIEYEAVTLQEETVTLGERWRREYNLKPYLRSLSNDDLVLYASRLSVDMSIIQLNQLAGRFAHLRCTYRFTELFEELNHRHIDVRGVKEQALREGMQVGDHKDVWEDAKILAEDCDVRVDI